MILYNNLIFEKIKRELKKVSDFCKIKGQRNGE